MKILVFRMNFAGKKWNEYLAEEFGEEVSKTFSVQSHTAAKMHDAKISVLNFTNNNELIEKIKQHPNVSSAYLVKNDKEYPIKLENTKATTAE